MDQDTEAGEDVGHDTAEELGGLLIQPVEESGPAFTDRPKKPLQHLVLGRQTRELHFPRRKQERQGADGVLKLCNDRRHYEQGDQAEHEQRAQHGEPEAQATPDAEPARE